MPRLDLDDISQGELSPDESAITPTGDLRAHVEVHRRELRLVAERLMLVAGVPGGAVRGAARFIERLVECKGADALALFRRVVERDTRWAGPGRRVNHQNIDATGTSFILAGGFILDAITAQLETTETVQVTVHGLLDLDIIDSSLDWPTATGAAVSLEVEAGLLTVRKLHKVVTPAFAGQLTEGIGVNAEVWWHLYFSSNRALSVDTGISRFHTGLQVPASGYL